MKMGTEFPVTTGASPHQGSFLITPDAPKNALGWLDAPAAASKPATPSGAATTAPATLHRGQTELFPALIHHLAKLGRHGAVLGSRAIEHFPAAPVAIFIRAGAIALTSRGRSLAGLLLLLTALVVGLLIGLLILLPLLAALFALLYYAIQVGGLILFRHLEEFLHFLAPALLTFLAQLLLLVRRQAARLLAHLPE